MIFKLICYLVIFHIDGCYVLLVLLCPPSLILLLLLLNLFSLPISPCPCSYPFYLFCDPLSLTYAMCVTTTMELLNEHFDDMHISLILPKYPLLLSYPPQHFVFYFNPLRPICAAHSFLDVGSSTGALSTYLGLSEKSQRKLSLFPSSHQ